MPRSLQIDLERTPYYHCVSRVVRRAYLCGMDHITGQSYQHRKTWLINRFQYLTQIFAVQITAYAVMDNHYHLVLYIDSHSSESWSDDEIIQRWKQIFPHDAQRLVALKNNGFSADKVQESVQKWKERLTNISWFMRCINEPLARLSNKEDDCTGRFWEGRFKSQALLDEAALISAMAYTDLNPIRAKMASTPEKSKYTSVYERIEALHKESKESKIKNPIYINKKLSYPTTLDKIKQPRYLMPFACESLSLSKKVLSQLPTTIPFHLSDYLELVDVTGRIIRDDKRGYIPDTIKPILQRLNLSDKGWLMMVNNIENDFAHAIGHLQKLNTFKPNHKRTLKGSSKAKIYYVA